MSGKARMEHAERGGAKLRATVRGSSKGKSSYNMASTSSHPHIEALLGRGNCKREQRTRKNPRHPPEAPPEVLLRPLRG